MKIKLRFEIEHDYGASDCPSKQLVLENFRTQISNFLQDSPDIGDFRSNRYYLTSIKILED